ncbi:MAG TPA: CopG family transcriptional regulator [Longimicrobiaceae bacterium]|jgi:metal-responsive CopG/Arc/MetJ family transcriptional regulator
MGDVTVHLDDDLERRLEQARACAGVSREDFVRDALRRHLARMQFEHLRGRVVPFAAARGYRVDEDVFREVS